MQLILLHPEWEPIPDTCQSHATKSKHCSGEFMVASQKLYHIAIYILKSFYINQMRFKAWSIHMFILYWVNFTRSITHMKSINQWITSGSCVLFDQGYGQECCYRLHPCCEFVSPHPKSDWLIVPIPKPSLGRKSQRFNQATQTWILKGFHGWQDWLLLHVRT